MNMQSINVGVAEADELAHSSEGILKILSDVDRKRSCGAFRAFEVRVFNHEVRTSLKNNEDHPYYSERWSDPQHTVVLVRDEIELAAKLKKLFPVQEGFVIESITERRLPEVV